LSKRRKQSKHTPQQPYQLKKHFLSAKNLNQKKYIQSIDNNQITFCQGPAGAGKTHIAVALALMGLFKGHWNRIIITRPLVQSGEDTGFLPGDIKKKLDPYVRPIYDEMRVYLNHSSLATFLNSEVIEIVPFAYMRGRNFNDAFIIADECQNALFKQLEMMLTRIGNDSKMVLTGDSSQSDLPEREQGGLHKWMKIIEHSNVDSIGIIHLEEQDIVRSSIVEKILSAKRKYDNQ